MDTLNLAPPADAVVLFDGKDLSHWQTRDGGVPGWEVKDGAVTVVGRTGNIVSKEKFTDFLLHLEWMEPDMPDAKGQAKGNSGVFLQGRYEIQVLDSYGIEVPGKGDCSGVYDQFAPIFNACRPPLEWQTYDIMFRAARADDSGNVVDNARLTVLQNCMVVHNNVEVLGVTGGAMDDKVLEPGPLLLQDHGNPVKFRNIWVLPLPLKGSDKY